nr:hypothetical protein [Halocynthiibacter namhaensis]
MTNRCTGGLKEVLAYLGQFQVARVPNDQSRAQFSLKSLQLLADHSLADTQFLRSRCNVSGFHNGNEIFEAV